MLALNEKILWKSMKCDINIANRFSPENGVTSNKLVDNDPLIKELKSGR